MPTVIFVDHLGQSQTVRAPEGGVLAKICDEVDSPVPFHCRRGNCGTCRIAVLEGIDELLPAQVSERRVLEIFGLSPQQHRLACQAQMRPGLELLRVTPLGKRGPRPYSLSVPVTLDKASKEIRAFPSDAHACDIVITGATELQVGTVVLVTFRLPSEAKSHNVVGRILNIEPVGDVVADTQRYTAAIEFREHDEILKTFFEPSAIGRP